MAIAIKSFETMTLREINLLHNKQLKRQYDTEIKKLGIDKIAKELIQTLYGAPIIEIYEAVEESKREFISQSIVPGAPIDMYPGITEAKAKKEYTCAFSGARIAIGSLYVSYRPMLKNMENGDAYVLKRTMRVEPAYIYYLPTTISELEDFNDKIIGYENPYNNDDIQYDNLYDQTGGGLQFKKLNRRKNENRNN